MRLVPTYPGDERLDLGLLRAVLRERARAGADDARRDLRGRRLSFSVVIPTYRRPETLFPVLDALGRQERAARVRGGRRRRRLGRRDAGPARGVPAGVIPSASSRRPTRAPPRPATAACARRRAVSSSFSATTRCPSRPARGARADARRAAALSGGRPRVHDVAAGPQGLALSPPHQRVRIAVRLRADRGHRVGAVQFFLHVERVAAARACFWTPASSTRASRTRRGRTSRSRTG